MQNHLKFPLAFGIFVEKNHKNDLILDLLVKHLLAYDPKTMGIWERREVSF